MVFFFSYITPMVSVGIAVYIMFVMKSVGMANIIITPEEDFARKHWT